MQKNKYYDDVRFNAEPIEEAHNKFVEIALKYKDNKIEQIKPQVLEIRIKTETWNFDHIEEFLSLLNEAEEYAFDHMIDDYRLRITGKTFTFGGCRDYTLVRFPERFDIETVFNIFEKKVKGCTIKMEKVEEEKKVSKIFIGHGHDKQWRDLKDQLTDQHGFEVNFYEIGPRAGTSIKDTLESMLHDSSFALLVFTGEDIDQAGIPHARENVIHELGLFQGKLGFNKAIILYEEGVKEFSNIIGLNQLRFAKGNIKEIFGDVIASLRKEL